MDKITFYKKIGFNTLLECCYIFGDITLGSISEIYYNAYYEAGKLHYTNEYNQSSFYELLKPLYDNMTKYVVPYNRSDELLDKIIIHAKNLEMVTEPYFTEETYDFIRYRLDELFMLYGLTTEDVINNYENTKWIRNTNS